MRPNQGGPPRYCGYRPVRDPGKLVIPYSGNRIYNPLSLTQLCVQSLMSSGRATSPTLPPHIIEIIQETMIAGVVATNTTISRPDLLSAQHLEAQTGGLSGQPIKHCSTRVIRYLTSKSNKSFAIIGVGGIHSPEDAFEKLEAGASLIQLYTGFIYEGPSLIKRILTKYLARIGPK